MLIVLLFSRSVMFNYWRPYGLRLYCPSLSPRVCESVSVSVVSNSLQPHGLYWSVWPFPSPGDLLDQGTFWLWSPALQADSLPPEPPGKFAEIHVHWVDDAIQPSHPLSSPSPHALKSFPASGSFPVSQLFASSSQSIVASVSTSVLPMNSQGWFPF